MGRSTTLKNDYFLWLCDRIKSKKYNHIKLCAVLHNKEFRWSVHNDDNRCQDGLNLRSQFIDEMNIDESHLEVRYFMKGACSVLEVLIALSQRINDMMYDLKDQSNKAPRWFNEMIKNLGLDKFTDDSSRGERLREMDETKIDDILETLMDRTYDFHGRGGLFPLKRTPRKHQAGVEIWYQMMDYLDENYGI